MIVIGADTHKHSHTAGAVDAATGRAVAERTVRARRRSFEDLLLWARGLDGDRVWALEDCRHVSGALERFLLARGEHVVRVAPKLAARERAASRERGKSDAIDATAIARAAVREGFDTLPTARLAGPELEIRLLADHRERLVAQRTALINDLRWHLHDLWPEFEIPDRVLTTARWQERVASRLARAEQTARVRIARDELRRIRELTRATDALHRELGVLVAQVAPQLLAERGCGVLIAAKLIGEIAGADRFATDAKLARIAGSAPIPAASGQTVRHRLDKGGNRQLNCALHRLAVTKARLDPTTAVYLARKQAEGKSRREAVRCLKRHLARRVWRLLHAAPAESPDATVLHCNTPLGQLRLDIGETSIGHQPLHGDAWSDEETPPRAAESRRRSRCARRRAPRVGRARAVIDADVHELPADPLLRVPRSPWTR